MLYNSIFARSFTKQEQKKLGFGALAACLFLAFSFCIMLKPQSAGLLPVLNLQILSKSVGIKKLMNINETISPQKLQDTVITKRGSMCSFIERTNYCDFEAPVRIHGESSSVFVSSFDMKISGDSTLKIRPYARKGDEIAMSKTREWSIKNVVNSQQMPPCIRNHSVPAILFSNGGYAGNHFHDFTDVVVPLFTTARKFNGEVQFLVTDIRSWWVSKYKAILSKLSKYDIIDIDKNTDFHCFPSAIVGLKRHKNELTIDELEHSYSMRDFKEFLRSSYSLKRANATEIRGDRRKKPQLLIVARRITRSFTNTKEISKMAKRMGFKVNVIEPDFNVKRVAEMVNSCDVMMGVHGAGLTNIVFLPENAVFIQIVPFGGAEWVAQHFFGEPSKKMGINYLEYRISMEESTLIQQYPVDDVVLKNPEAIQLQGWGAFKSIYLDRQNVNLNVKRFKPTLVKALELLHQRSSSSPKVD